MKAPIVVLILGVNYSAAVIAAGRPQEVFYHKLGIMHPQQATVLRLADMSYQFSCSHQLSVKGLKRLMGLDDKEQGAA